MKPRWQANKYYLSKFVVLPNDSISFSISLGRIMVHSFRNDPYGIKDRLDGKKAKSNAEAKKVVDDFLAKILVFS